MAVVVSDTSPVRALAHLGCIGWLEALFRRVILPPAVAHELLHPPAAYPAINVSTWPYLEVRAPGHPSRVAELRAVLDPGEAEAIALAEELVAEIVLVDELAGRDVALSCGFTVLGTLGILVRAKQQGLCDNVAPLLHELQTGLNFFISGELRRKILEQAGE